MKIRYFLLLLIPLLTQCNSEQIDKGTYRVEWIVSINQIYNAGSARVPVDKPTAIKLFDNYYFKIAVRNFVPLPLRDRAADCPKCRFVEYLIYKGDKLLYKPRFFVDENEEVALDTTPEECPEALRIGIKMVRE